jgi:hypothetical protein
VGEASVVAGDAAYEQVYSLPGGIRSMLAVYRAMLVDGEQNRESAKTKLTLPVLAGRRCVYRGA